MYKIFINDKPFIISNKNVDEKRFEELETIQFQPIVSIMDLVRKAEDKNSKGILLICEDPKSIFLEFRAHFTSIEAGGGVVFNKDHQVLLIKRLGKWDLPKGKIDPGEKMEECAIREVEEECGIDRLSIKNYLGNSYHSYKLQGHRFLKITHWYIMETEFEGKMTPQAEENITEVIWQDWSTIQIEELETYTSIKEILHEAKVYKP